MAYYDQPEIQHLNIDFCSEFVLLIRNYHEPSGRFIEGAFRAHPWTINCSLPVQACPDAL